MNALTINEKENTLIYNEKEYYIIDHNIFPIGECGDSGVEEYTIISPSTGVISKLSQRYDFNGFEMVYNEEQDDWYPGGEAEYIFSDITQTFLIKITPLNDGELLVTPIN